MGSPRSIGTPESNGAPAAELVDHQTAVLGVFTKLQSGAVERDRILAELYVTSHETRQFIQEFRAVLATMASGKIGGLLGRLVGGKQEVS